MQEMEKIFRDILKKYDSVLEELNDHVFYLTVLILGSPNFAIGNMLDDFFKECPYLSTEYYLTNMEIPTDDLIKDWLDGKLDDEP
jgi:hypothetical protein